VVALDTNVLVYAEITSSPRHAAARDCLRTLAEGAAPWAIAWPCVYEFLRVVTHPRVYHPPVPLETARADLTSILASPSLLLLGETIRHAEVLDDVLAESGATGNLVHDAHIVALCREHGVREIVTGDSDFRRFSGLTVTDPFTVRRSRRR
jgi:toxin-antitoxin system PIN domain toxin